MRKIFIIFIVLCICMPIYIRSAAESIFEYTTVNNQAIITGLKSNAKSPAYLELPSVIDGYTVVGIGDEAFSERYFDGIAIPDTIKSIGYMSFYGTCVKTDPKIIIPKSVETIGTYAFSYMRGVEAFEVDAENNYYTSEDGVLFNVNKKELLYYPLSKTEETYILPEETELLFCTSFGNCSNLKNLVLQNNKVKRMGYTFFGCDMTLFGDPDSYERLWMDELTDIHQYGKVRFGGTYQVNDSLLEQVKEGSSRVTPDNDISVIINGKKMFFEQEPVTFNSRVLVPLRAIFEELGASVTWNNDTRVVTAEKNNLKIILRIDDEVMMVNNKEYFLDAPAQLINSRTFVPVRAVSEAFGANVSWDNDTKTVYIDTAKELSLSLNNAKTVVLGWNINDLIEELGRPNRKEISIYGLEWYVYNSDYNNFIMVAVDAGKVCGYYTNSKGFSLSNGIYYGCLSDSNFESQRGIYIKAYVDKLKDNAVHAVLVSLYDYSNKAETTSKEFFHIQSLENFDATNAFRANYGLPALLWDEYAATAAQRHSQDMADNNYFSHTSLDGRNAIDRYSNINEVSWKQWGENISAGRAFGLDSFDGWLNSEGHRKNMLNENHKYLGVGEGYNLDSTYHYYITQSFITY